MNKDELKEKIFDEMLTYASEKSIEDIIETLPNEEKLKEEIAFSAEFEEKMQVLIKNYNRREKLKKIVALTKRAAIILIILITIGAITIMSVEAFRVKFFNIITEWKEEYTLFKFQEDEARNSEESNIIYFPEYIPQGFELFNTQEAGELHRVIYQKEDKRIIFIQSRVDITDTAIDTEEAEINKVWISGNEGYLIDRGDSTSILWQNHIKVFTIHGDITSEELIKMAESIKPD